MRIVIFLLLSFTAHAESLKLSEGKTSFLAVGRPSALKINGTGKGPVGEFKLEKAADAFLMTGEATMDLASFDTGIGMRDRHMKEKYLEVEKFKEAKLAFAAAKIPAAVMKTGGELKLDATLELHGVKKPVAVAMTIAGGEKARTTVAKFKIKLSDFAIDVPKFSGVTVADEVEITAESKVL